MARSPTRSSGSHPVRASAAGGALLLGALVLTPTGCSAPPAATGLSALDGRLVGEATIYLAFDDRWRRAAGAPLCFEQEATMAIGVTSAPTDGVTLHFEGVAGTLGAVLDGRRVPTERVSGREAAPRESAGVWRLELPAESLPPGTHDLELSLEQSRERNLEPDPELLPEAGSAGSGASLCLVETTSLESVVRDGREPLFSFLRTGLVGPRERQLGGALFRGPGRLEHSFRPPSPGSLAFDLRNLARFEAEFVVAVGGDRHTFTVAGRGERSVVVPVRGGAEPLSLAVDGAPRGLSLFGAPSFRPASPPAWPPSVLLITLDTTRTDALSPYGAPPEVTPHLTELSKRSVLYESAYATAPWTLPSHASIFTGLYPSHHGAGVHRDRLSPRWDTLAQRLRRRGYATAAFVGGVYTTPEWGFGRGFQRFTAPPAIELAGDHLTVAARRWLAAGDREPFFLFVNYFDPHGTYTPPDPWRHRFVDPRDAADIAGFPVWSEWAATDSHPAWLTLRRGDAGFPEAGLDYMRARYLGEVAYMDDQLGLLLGELEARALLDGMLVVVVADHGDLLGERRRFGHSNSLDPELNHVPLLVKWPGQKRPFREPSPVSQVDLYATILEAAGIPGPYGDGRPLPRPAHLPGAPGGPRRASVLAEEHEIGHHKLTRPYRLGPHSFSRWWQGGGVVFWPGGAECYLRDADGSWSRTVCDGGSDEASRSELGRLPPGFRLDSGSAESSRPSARELERLRALGYVN